MFTQTELKLLKRDLLRTIEQNWIETIIFMYGKKSREDATMVAASLLRLLNFG
jgi:hypothetical protein